MAGRAGVAIGDRMRLAAVPAATAAMAGVGALACGLQVLLGRALCRLVPPELHDEVTRRVFDDAPGWGPGGQEFEKRLFSWEEEFLAAAQPGLILLGGAGGGREIAGLAAMGRDVVAFEPSDLVESADATARRLGLPAVLRAAYQDLPSAVDGRGPLAGVPFDAVAAVVLGWGSFCHLTTRRARIEVLRALRALAPLAPVLYSFNWRGADHRPYADRARLRFDPELGFFAALQWPDVHHEAAAAGYRVQHARDEPTPHAWLLPDPP